MDGQYLPDDEIDIDSLASSEPPEYVPQMFSEGGEVEEEDIEYYAKGGEASFDQSVQEMNKYLLADEADTAYAPMYPSEPKASERDTKTAKLMLKQLSTKSGGGGKSKRSKEMSLATGDLSPAIPDLGAPPTEQEKLTQIATARSQYDALEQAYKLKAQAAQRAGKGLMRPTFNTVMFDQPTLEKAGPLMARTFAKGGEADKEDLPGLYGVSDYAREESANMFPEEKGQWDRQDSARHMLAAATLARKYGPRAAELAGQAHELMASPIRFIGSKMGVMKESPDYAQDIHNNRLGIELASKSKNQEELLALVRQMALQAREGQTPGKASTGKPTGASDSVGRYGSQGPVKPIKMAMGGLPFAPTAQVRPSTRAELDAIKSQYEEYDRKAAVYNAALQKYQAEVYAPYNAQADAYNAALEKYKAEQFNPYQTQVDAYNAALEKYRVEQFNPYQAQIDAYNAALNKYKAEIYDPYSAAVDRYNADNSAPVPVAPADFSMAVPAAPAQFGMTAPTAPAQFGGTMPTRPADFAQPVPAAPSVSAEDYQAKMAAAKKEAANRQLALNVAMDPEAYNLSMPKLFANGGPVYRAEGSPASGERLTPQQIEQLAADQAALNQYYAPKARVSTGMNRQKGPISKQLDTGEAYVNMAKGVTEFPYDLLGAPRDISNMIMTPFGYGVKNPVMGSDWIKAQMTKAGVRPEPPADPTAKGFYTAGELLSNLTNPAGVTRAGVKVAKKTGETATNVAKDFQQYNRQLAVPGASYAVRPEGGGTTFTGVQSTGKSNAPISKLDKMIDAGANPGIAGLSNEMGDAIENFWRSKGQNYFTRQYGTPSDPIFKQIMSGQLRTPALQKQIPDYAIEQTQVGKTRVDPVTGESRFYPKYPQALEDLTRRYDEMTGVRGLAFNTKEPLFDPSYPSTMGDRGRQLESQLKDDITEKMVAGGLDPNLINPNVSLTGPRGDGSSDLLNYIPSEYKELYNLYKQPPEEPNMINRIYKELGLSETKVPGVVPENIKRAIQTSEPIYDIDMPYKSVLEDLLSPRNINQYLATLSPKEITKMRFEDVVKNSARYNLDMFNTQNLVNAVKGGKRIPEKTWKQGLSEPLMNFEKEGQNFTWHRILDNEATAIEGAYIGHSVGGYAKGGAYGPKEYRRFKEGEEVQVYTLRDSKGKPFTTIQVEKAYTGPLGRVLSESDIARAKAEGRELGPMSTIVKQIKGNGAKTGNVAPKDADEGVLSFLKTYIKPDKIAESDSYLTPKLEEFKMDLSGRPRP